MRHLTAVAVSGGIDSLVAAFLIKDTGHDVLGIHFKTGFETSDQDITNNQTDIARHVSSQLGIPVTTLELNDLFEASVVNYFIESYRDGRTPNPCLVCNPAIKFGALLEFAQQQGASRMATGHYVRTETGPSGVHHLKKGADPGKDQSYFLAFLTQRHLASAFFPLGDLTKNDVRHIAENNGLRPVSEKESQDVCFIRGMSYPEFIKSRGMGTSPGPIKDTQDNVLGRHNGLHLFTIGQRRGINCPAHEPYYVIRMDMEDNALIVGFKPELYKENCRVEQVNWIGRMPTSTVALHTRIRYSHEGVLSRVTPETDGTASVIFDSPQPAVTPGQGAVFYNNDEVVGGGWIV